MFMVNSDCIPFMSSRSAFIWKLWGERGYWWRWWGWGPATEQIFTIKLERIEIFSHLQQPLTMSQDASSLLPPPSAAAGRRSELDPTKSWNSNLCFLNIPQPGWLLTGWPGIHSICLYFLWFMISRGAVISILYLEGAFSTLNISSNKTFLFSVQNVNKLKSLYAFYNSI